jgi:hypothetical protein
MTKLPSEDDPVQQITEIQIKILQKKLKGKTDSLFYGEVAHGFTTDGSHFIVETVGEIRLTYKGEEYTGGSLGGKLHRILDELNDKKIADEVEFENNDWFEVRGNEKNGDFLDLGDGYIAHEYDGAIEILKNAMRDYENGHWHNGNWNDDPDERRNKK